VSRAPRITRRGLLRAAGIGGAASLLFPSLLWPRPARAALGPPRVIFFTTQHGAPRQHWKMNVAGLPASTDGAVSLAGLASSDFSHVLAPLYDVRSRLSIVEGLDMMSAMLDQPGNNHGVSWAHLLTNAFGNYDEPFQTGGGIHPYARTMSIDQYIARQVVLPGMIPSVEWGYGGRFGSGPIGYSTGPDGAWLPYEDDPSRAFARLFPDGPPAPEAPTAPTRRDRIAAHRASVLDLAADQYARVIPTLGAEDRRRLELHRDEVRALETRLRVAPGGGALGTCDPTFASEGERMDQFFRLVTIAFSCDLTRVATLNVGQLSPGDFGAPPGDVHEEYAHGTSAEAHLAMADYYRYHARQFRDLLSSLDAVPDGDGTLLDSTIVIWLTELATGSHDMGDSLVVVGGGGAGTLSPGRYIRFARSRPSPCDHYGCLGGDEVGLPQSHLFVSAMRAMGLPDDSFGLRSGTARDGSTIDLTGPLPLL
jgi:hypothetical protein